MLPLLLYAALRRYFQGMALVRPLMVALVVSNVVNIAGNWALRRRPLGDAGPGGRGVGLGDDVPRATRVVLILIAAAIGPIGGTRRGSGGRRLAARARGG